MTTERFKGDPNFKAGGVVGGYSSADAIGATDPTLLVLRIDPTTGRLLVDMPFDTVADGDAVAASTEGLLAFGSDGTNYFPLLTDDTGALQVVATIALDEDTDDDSIAKAQTLPLIINENYLFSKTDDAWIRVQGSDDGFQFVTIAGGIFDSGGHELAIDADGDINANIASIVPGIAAANLGKAEDAGHTSGDVGVMALAVRQDAVGTLVSADGDYTPLIVSEHGGLHTEPQHVIAPDEFEATAGWTVLGDDAISLATTTNHVCKTVALEFDKVDGSDDTTIAGIQKTITSIATCPYVESGGFALVPFYISSTAAVDYVFLRLGTDSSNYNEWRLSNDNDTFVAGWNLGRMPLTTPAAVVGNGISTVAVTYMVVGISFDAETDELADIAFDRVSLNSGLQTSSDITSEITSAVNSANMRLIGYGGSVDTDQGNASTGSLRVVVADDDTNLLAITTALEKIDDWEGAGNYADYLKSALYIDNGSGSPIIVLGDASGHMQVDVVSAPSTVVTASNLDIRDLAATQDDILIYANTVKDGSGTDYVPLLDSDGHLQVDALNIATLIGEVQATPTENTVLDRLKDIATGQLADSHNVTVDNAAGAGVYIRPGTSAVFTVDLAGNNDVTIDDSSIVHLEDVQHSTGDAGVMALAVENEDQADLSTGDKDYTPIAVTKEGNIIIKPEGTITVDGTVTANLGEVDNAVLDNIALYTQGSETALETLDNVIATISSTVISRVAIYDDSDTQITSFGAGVQYDEDEDHAAGDTGTMALAVRDDALEANAAVGADLDYIPLRGDNYGAL